MEFIPLALPGLILIRPGAAHDARGLFLKTYHQEMFFREGIHFVPKEEFYSISKAGVLRGMHFQAPPSDYSKLVHCVRGRIHDVALDLRLGSPTYGQVWSGELNSISRESLYLPTGFAHGFLSLEEDSIVSYSTSHIHDSRLDSGIHWDSFGHSWPCSTPNISPRDGGLPLLDGFSSPFTYL